MSEDAKGWRWPLILSDLPEWYMGYMGGSFLSAEWRVRFAHALAAVHELIAVAGDVFVSQLGPDDLRRWVDAKMDRGAPRAEIEAQSWELSVMFSALDDHSRLGPSLAAWFNQQRWVKVPPAYDGLPRAARMRPLEKALHYRELMRREPLTQQQWAERLGISQGALSRALRLLELPRDLLDLLRAGRIAPTTALAIGRITDAGHRAEMIDAAKSGDLRREDVLRRADTTCPVVLKGRGRPAYVLERKKPPLTPMAYDAVAVLVKAWPGRVGKKELEAPRSKGGAGSTARYNLRKLAASDPDWEAVIGMAGRAHQGFGIVTFVTPPARSAASNGVHAVRMHRDD